MECGARDPPDADDATLAALGFLFGGLSYAFPGRLLGLAR